MKSMDGWNCIDLQKKYRQFLQIVFYWFYELFNGLCSPHHNELMDVAQISNMAVFIRHKYHKSLLWRICEFHLRIVRVSKYASTISMIFKTNRQIKWIDPNYKLPIYFFRLKFKHYMMNEANLYCHFHVCVLIEALLHLKRP